MEIEIKMIAKRRVSESEKITPLMVPLASCLHYSFMSTHCSACFSAIDKTTSGIKSGFVTYCSTKCAAADCPIYYRSGEHELFLFLQTYPDHWPFDDPWFHDVSYLRLALRLLLLLPPPSTITTNTTNRGGLPFPPRILGLSWGDPDDSPTVEYGAYAIAKAMAECQGTRFCGPRGLFYFESVLTLVMTNALRVSLDDTTPNPIGIALYDYRISWLNHSCTPNSHVNFVHAFQPMSTDQDQDDEDVELPIEPQLSRGSLDRLVGLSAPCTVSQLLNGDGPLIHSKLPNGHLCYGPRAAVQTLSEVQLGEEVKISYIDSSLSKELRTSTLLHEYGFPCNCTRCYWIYAEAEDDDSGSDICGEAISSITQNPELKEQEIVAEGSTSSAPQDTDRSAGRLDEGILGVLSKKEFPSGEIVPKGSTSSAPQDTDRSAGRLDEGILGVLSKKEFPSGEIVPKGSTSFTPEDTLGVPSKIKSLTKSLSVNARCFRKSVIRKVRMIQLH